MIIIHCKDCGALFYAVTNVTDGDVVEIMSHAKSGHEVQRIPDSGVTVEACICPPPDLLAACKKAMWVYDNWADLRNADIENMVDELKAAIANAGNQHA